MKKCPYRLLIIPLAGLLLAACDPQALRQCGVFDHPDLSNWQADSGVGTLRLMSSDGAMLNLARSAVELNKPFTGSAIGTKEEDVVCSLTATVRYTSTDESLQIITRYTQYERTVQQSADESLAVHSSLEAPVGTPRFGDYSAALGIEPDRQLIVFRNAVDYLGVAEIGGISYDDVIQINAVESFSVSTSPSGSHDVIKQMVFARTFGLIAVTDGDGKRFVRVADDG